MRMVQLGRVNVCLDRGWLGVRVGRRHLKIRDTRRHPLRFSERNRFGYRRLLVVGEHWEAGMTAKARTEPWEGTLEPEGEGWEMTAWPPTPAAATDERFQNRP